MEDSLQISALQEQVRYLALLEGAAYRLNSTLDLDLLLENIVEEVALTFGCSRFSDLTRQQGRYRDRACCGPWLDDERTSKGVSGLP